ncbi:hypothetical protein [Arthrobacter sp. UYCo732]|uniref:hypothetical protein n=1 Tax=Arthrobacter sp. UYCo732 TaxID=3156336 RepID=UPI00339A7BA5
MTLYTLPSAAMSEAPQRLAAALEAHASTKALAGFMAAAGRAGDLVDNSLPHLQELVRLTIVNLVLTRPGIDDGGELERLADGIASDEDMDVLNEDETKEILRYVLDGDWDMPGALALAANLYLQNNPAPDTEIIDAALEEMTSFLDAQSSAAAVPGPVHEIVLLQPGTLEERKAA